MLLSGTCMVVKKATGESVLKINQVSAELVDEVFRGRQGEPIMSIAIHVNNAGTMAVGGGAQNIDSQIQSLQHQVQHLQGTVKGVSEQISATAVSDPNQVVLEQELQDLERQIEQIYQRMMQLQEQKVRQAKQQEMNKQLSPDHFHPGGSDTGVQPVPAPGHIDTLA